MLKLIPMPNPIKLATESYKMTNVGKALIGSTIAGAALDAYQNSQHQAQPQPAYNDPVQETWAFYGKAIQAMSKKPNLVQWWNSISAERKQNAILQVFLNEGRGHLVPYLQQHVFPTIR
jgi:hypothetical protein